MPDPEVYGGRGVTGQHAGGACPAPTARLFLRQMHNFILMPHRGQDFLDQIHGA